MAEDNNEGGRGCYYDTRSFSVAGRTVLSVSGRERHSIPVTVAIVPISNMYRPEKY